VTNITAILIKSFGFLCAHVPECTLAFFAKVIGHLLVALPSRRRRILLSNLDRAFPEWPRDRLLKVARASAACLVEMGLFSLTYPFLSKDHIRRLLHIPPETERKLNELRRSNKPVVFFIPHVALFELLVASPHFRPGGSRKLGAVYRPNSNSVIDKWILNARNRQGLLMFARGPNLTATKGHLRHKNWLGILFDQNAGLYGNLSTFLDRLASVTPLPAILAIGTKAKPVFAVTERTDFFRATLHLTELNGSGAKSLTAEAHNLLEKHLRSSDKKCSEWLWAHARWKTQNQPNKHLRIAAKRNWLPTSLNLTKKTKLWIRLPNWLGDVVMALPLIKAISEARPDAELTLLCQPQFRPLLEHFNIGKSFKELPPKNAINYYYQIFQWRRESPDLQLLFTNSLRGDIEARLIDATARYGINRPGKNRHLLTHAFNASAKDLCGHQTLLWERFLQHFGLENKIRFSPFVLKDTATKILDRRIVGIAPGSSNNPSKRWPTKQWCKLLENLLPKDQDLQFRLFGTLEDLSITNIIEAELPSSHVKNLAGTTDMVGLVKGLSQCDLLVCNDSGAMHLANAIGIPVLALFGPTDANTTGPAYEAPHTLIYPSEKQTTNAFNKTMSAIDLDSVIQSACRLLHI
jgi:heptosyltransferase II